MDADVVIVGGGPAGLSAALVLGRCRRRVLLFDHGRYRNTRARSMHGYLTRDGIDPAELRRIAHEELAAYASVTLRAAEVVHASRIPQGFEVVLSTGERLACRKLLLATGLTDTLPALPGIDELVGLCAFHCPYCDGWELRDQALVAYGAGNQGAELALELTLWSARVSFCCAGRVPDPSTRERLARFSIDVYEQPISHVQGDAQQIRVTFADGSALTRRALFYSEGAEQASSLPALLGVDFTHKGGVEAGRLEMTSEPGVYVAGDASRDALQAVVAAGEGSKAACAINRALLKEDVLAP